MVTIYGIKNCDTMKKAMRWLDEHGVEYRFHDYRRDGLDAAAGADVPDLSYGDQGPMVAELNRRLNQAGFNADDADDFGRETRHAVYAFQKHHEMRTDGVFSEAMWDVLAEPIELPRQQYPDRVEVNLGTQTLYVVEGQEVVYIAPISSGNGEVYESSSGGRASAPGRGAAGCARRRARRRAAG